MATAIWLRMRIRLAGPWTPNSFGAAPLLSLTDGPSPEQTFDVRVTASNQQNLGTLIQPCAWGLCPAGEFIPSSDDGWHTLVVFHPNDGVSPVRYHWDDDSSIEEIGVSTLPAPFSFGYAHMGWAADVLQGGPSVSIDDIRVCTAGPPCGWPE